MTEENAGVKLVRIFAGESGKIGQQTLHEAIVYEARKQSLSGKDKGIDQKGSGIYLKNKIRGWITIKNAEIIRYRARGMNKFGV